MSKLDDVLTAISEQAEKLDGLEIAAGGTVTQATLDAVAAVSATLKSLAVVVEEPVVVKKSSYPKGGS